MKKLLNCISSIMEETAICKSIIQQWICSHLFWSILNYSIIFKSFFRHRLQLGISVTRKYSTILAYMRLTEQIWRTRLSSNNRLLLRLLSATEPTADDQSREQITWHLQCHLWVEMIITSWWLHGLFFFSFFHISILCDFFSNCRKNFVNVKNA